MKNIICILVILLASPAAFAAGGFFTPEALPVRPENFDNAVAATALLRTEVADTGNCSAVLLSNDGYVATNIHCLHTCLDKQWGLYDPQIEQREFEKVDYSGPEPKGILIYKGLRIFESVPTRLECPDYSKNRLELEQYGLKNPKVVWIGRGRQSHTQTRIAKITEEEFNIFKDLTEDVAVLKYERTHSRPLPCLHVAKSPAKDKDPLWLVSYPAATERGSKQHRLSVSYGNARDGVENDPIYQRQASKVAPGERALFWSREKEIWEVPHLVTSDVDGYSGSSGGALINANGELTGIAFAMTTISSTSYEAPSLYSVRAQHLRNKVIQDLGASKAREVFDCEDVNAR